MAKRQANIELETGAYKAARTKDQVQRVLGSQRAAFAANGVGMTGSSQDVVLDSAQEGALDVAAIQWNSGLAADNLRYKASVSKMNAGIAGAAIGPAFLAPTISGVAEYASSFG